MWSVIPSHRSSPQWNRCCGRHKTTMVVRDATNSCTARSRCRLGTHTAVLTTRFRNDLDGELRLQEAILGSSKYLGIVFEELTGTSDSTDVFLYDLSVPDRRYFTFNRDGTREGLQAVVTRN